MKGKMTLVGLAIVFLSVAAFLASSAIPTVAPAPFRIGIDISGIVSDSDISAAIDNSDVWIRSITSGCFLVNTSGQTLPTSPFYTNANGYYQTYNTNDKIALDSTNTARCTLEVSANKTGYVNRSIQAALCGQIIVDMNNYNLGDVAQFTQNCGLQKNVKMIVREYATENIVAGNVGDGTVTQALDPNGVAYFGEMSTPITFTYTDPTNPYIHNTNITTFSLVFGNGQQNVFTLYTKKHASLSTSLILDELKTYTENFFVATATITNGDVATTAASSTTAAISFSPNGCGETTSTTQSIGTLAGGATAQVIWNVKAKLESTCTVTVTPAGTDAEDNAPAYTSADSKSILVMDPPKWSNLRTNPSSPATYTKGGKYQFNSTWIDNTGVSVVYLEFDGVNYTASNEGNEYYLNIYDLPVGSYQYKWYASDSNGYWNYTDYYTYQVAKNMPTLKLTLNDVEGDNTITYKDALNVLGSVTDGDTNAITRLLRDGNEVSNPDQTELGAGTYVYNFTYDTTQNYTDGWISYTLTVGKAGVDVRLFLNDVEGDNSQIYGSISNATAIINVTGLTVNLERNGILISAVNIVSDIQTLAAGTYNYTAYVPENANYTGDSITYILTVNKTAPSIKLELNGVDSDNAINYKDVLNVTGSVTAGDSGATTKLFRNSSEVSNPDSTELAAGTYEYNFTYDESANYTAAWASHILSVNKTAPTLKLFLNGIEGDNSIVFSAPVNVTGILISGDSSATLMLDRDGITVSNPDQTGLGGGVYKYTWTYSESENYTANSVSYNLTISAASNSVSLYINDVLNDNATQTYGTDSNATATSLYGTVALYRDDIAVNNPEITTLGGGVYKYTANVSGTANYTSASQEFYLVVNPVSTTVTLYLNGNNNDTTITYGSQSNATAVSDIGAINLYRDGILISNPEIATLGGGTYVYEANITGNENYTSASQTFTLTVNKQLSSVDLYLNGNQSDIAIVYGTESNATAVGANGNVILYRDDIVVSNPEIATLGADTYNYTATIPEDQNTTGSSKTFFLTVNKIVPTIKLYLDDVEWTADTSRTYPATTSVNGTIDVVDLQSSVTLIRNSTSVSNPDNTELGAGTYIYNASFAGNQNYSAVSIAKTLTIDKGTGVANLTFDTAPPIIYGTQHRATCTGNSDGTFTLYRDGQDVTSTENAVLLTLGAGIYNYNCTLAEGTNYTAASITANYTIDKQPTSVDLYLNDVQSDVTITYGAQSNATAVGYNGTVILYRDGNVVANPDVGTLAAGSYNYTAVIPEDANKTGSSKTFFLTINKAAVDVRLFLNGNESDLTLDSGAQSNATATINVTELNVSLERDGTTVSNPDIQTLSAGTYNYTAYVLESANYTGGSVTYMLTINPPPAFIITVESPQNTTYQTSSIWMNATTNRNASWVNVSIDSGAYQLLTNSSGNWNYLSTLSEGVHTAVFSGLSNDGISNTTNVVYFTIPCLSNLTDTTVDGIYYASTRQNILSGTTTITCSNVTSSNVTNSTIKNSRVVNKILDMMIIEDSEVDPHYGISSKNSTINQGSNVSQSMVNHSTVTGKSNVSDSEIIYSIINASNIYNSTVWWSNVLRSWVVDTPVNLSTITDSYVRNSTVTSSTITNSTVNNSYVSNSTITNSDVQYSTTTNSTVQGSTITDSNLTNSWIYNSTLDGVTAGWANITDNQLIGGWVVINGTNYTTPTNLTAASEGGDASAPTINSLAVSNSTPAAGDTITLTINATDNVGISNITVNSTLATYSSGDLWTAQIIVPTTNGNYLYPIVAMDYSGNTAQQNFGLIVNTNATPQVIIDMQGPNVGMVLPNATTAGSVTFTVAASDNVEVSNCTLNIGNSTFLMSGTPFRNGTASLTGIITIGNYLKFATCSDIFGNLANGTITNITVTLPSISSPAPPGPSGGMGTGFTGFTSVRPIFVLDAPSDVIIRPGSTASFDIILKNVGDASADNVIISLIGIPVSWFTLDMRTTSLGINATLSTTITITVPETEPIGTRKLTINANSKEGTSITKSIALLITNVTKVAIPTTPPVTTPLAGVTGAILGVISNPMAPIIAAVLVVFGVAYWLIRRWKIKTPIQMLEEPAEHSVKEEKQKTKRRYV